jgi:hypothetical protein
MEPTIGRIVHYRLTREDAQSVNRRYVDARNHIADHRKNANGVQVHVGNQQHAGDVVPLLIVRVWPDEYSTDSAVCRDYVAGKDGEPEFSFPLSSCGVNGQAFLDGNDSLWVCSAPQGEFNGAWNWPPVKIPAGMYMIES